MLGAFRILCAVTGLTLAAFVGCCTLGAAADGRGWRGDGSGRFPDAQPPRVWSEASGVVWKRELPGGGHASPMLAAGRLFVAAEPSDLVCVSAADGTIAWR